MKLVISNKPCCFLDLGAPTAGCAGVVIDAVLNWRFWYRYCERFNYPGPREEHRLAHFGKSPSLNWETGHNLAPAEGSMITRRICPPLLVGCNLPNQLCSI